MLRNSGYKWFVKCKFCGDVRLENILTSSQTDLI